VAVLQASPSAPHICQRILVDMNQNRHAIEVAFVFGRGGLQIILIRMRSVAFFILLNCILAQKKEDLSSFMGVVGLDLPETPRG
jgi:uncharacterized membrane protein YhfC